MLTILTVASLLLLCSPAGALDSTWDAAGGLLPDQLARPHELIDTADPEDPVLAGGVMTLETSDDAELLYYRQSAPDVDPTDPWIIEFEMRLVSGSSSNAFRGSARITATPRTDTLTVLEVGIDSIFLLAGNAAIDDSAVVDTDEAFHIYRIEIAGDDSVEVYYDDVLTLTGQAFADAPREAGRLTWGNSSVASQGVSEWLSFSHDGLTPLCGDGIVDPPETCDDGNTSGGDGCDAACMVEPVCAPAPAIGCHVAAKASLSVVEKKPGREKLKAKLGKFVAATSLMDLGDPVAAGGTRYDLCLYDGAGLLVGELSVDRGGDLCGAKQKPCWKAKSDKGYTYKDPATVASGVKKIAAVAGAAGKGKVQVQAGNKATKGQNDMPTGIAADLMGATSASMQVLTSDGLCFEAALDTVKKADGVQFKAKTP